MRLARYFIRDIVPKPVLGERQRHPRRMLPSFNRRDRTQHGSVYGIDLDRSSEFHLNSEAVSAKPAVVVVYPHRVPAIGVPKKALCELGAEGRNHVLGDAPVE